MADPIFYVDTSDIHEGKLEEVKLLIKGLVEFIDANVPRAMAYGIFLNPEGTMISVVQTHPDSEAFVFHMKVGGPEFAKFADHITLRSIDVYGEISAELRDALDRKAKMLGDGSAVVRVHRLEAGFHR
jgi:hypothetical protein